MPHPTAILDTYEPPARLSPVLILQGDARHLPLADASVQCVITSPPYWGLRDYGLGTVGLGLEATPEAYVQALVAVLTGVWRVLRADGTVWLNLGDSYAGSWKNQGRKEDRGTQRPINGPMLQAFDGHPAPAHNAGVVPDGLKAKDLVGIPWRVAFALQAAGWYLRSDIIWSKPNPMPESVRDRPTRAHEYLFLLSKRARYYYDASAVAEPVSGAMLQEVAQGYTGKARKDYGAAGAQDPSSVKARIIANARLKGNARTFRGGGAYVQGQSFENGGNVPRESHGNLPNPTLTRNKRTVWTITPQPYRGAHFATFPEALVTPCLLAGSRPGDLVLDPFAGSGTVGLVATQHGRRAVLVEASGSYCQLAQERLRLTSAQARP